MAFRTYLQSKLHKATVTSAKLDYEGSISICTDLLESAGMHIHEKVEIYNINNGERLATYIIPGKKGEIGLNGAAAHKAAIGDKVIIAAYTQLTPEEAAQHKPCIVLLGPENKVKEIRDYSGEKK